MRLLREISPYVVFGATAFWLVDVVLNAFHINSLLLFTLVPTLGFLTFYVIARKIGRKKQHPSIAVFGVLGVWLLGSTATMVGASFSGGGFKTGLLETFIVILLGLLPPYTMIMSAYDGSLLALLLITCFGVGAHLQFEIEHWVLPPALRLNIQRWYASRVAKNS
jgi:hypothetical protein